MTHRYDEPLRPADRRNRGRVKISLPRLFKLILKCSIIIFAGIILINIIQSFNVVSNPLQGEIEANNNSYNKEESDVNTLDKNTLDINTIDISNSHWNLILANPWNKVPDDFAVARTLLKNGQSIDERAYPDLQQMMDDARAVGLSPSIISSFRTMDKQKALFTNKVNRCIASGYSYEDAVIEAARWVAYPGTSEHQTGLALDIVAESYPELEKEQENTPEQKWLMENSYKYGFILRYPKDKTDITGIAYEPWHYRYVGKEAAKEIYEKGICLEEYLESLIV